MAITTVVLSYNCDILKHHWCDYHQRFFRVVLTYLESMVIYNSAITFLHVKQTFRKLDYSKTMPLFGNNIVTRIETYVTEHAKNKIMYVLILSFKLGNNIILQQWLLTYIAGTSSQYWIIICGSVILFCIVWVVLASVILLSRRGKTHVLSQT